MPSACTPKHTPTMSTIESIAPTSWKCTSSSETPWTCASAAASPSKVRSAETRTGSGRSCGLEHLLDRGPVPVGRLLGGFDAHAHGRDAVRAHALDGDARLGRERGGERLQVLGGELAGQLADVEQRAEELVARDAGGAVEVPDHGCGVFRRRRRRAPRPTRAG